MSYFIKNKKSILIRLKSYVLSNQDGKLILKYYKKLYPIAIVIGKAKINKILKNDKIIFLFFIEKIIPIIPKIGQMKIVASPIGLNPFPSINSKLWTGKNKDISQIARPKINTGISICFFISSSYVLEYYPNKTH